MDFKFTGMDGDGDKLSSPVQLSTCEQNSTQNQRWVTTHPLVHGGLTWKLSNVEVRHFRVLNFRSSSRYAGTTALRTRMSTGDDDATLQPQAG